MRTRGPQSISFSHSDSARKQTLKWKRCKARPRCLGSELLIRNVYIFPEKKGEGPSGLLLLSFPVDRLCKTQEWWWWCWGGCPRSGSGSATLGVCLEGCAAARGPLSWLRCLITQHFWPFSGQFGNSCVFFFGGPLLVRGWAWRRQEALNALPPALPKHFPELLLAFWGTRGVRALLLHLPGPSRSLVPIRTETLAAVVVAVPPAPGCSVPCLGDGSCRSDALHSGETAGEEAFANQLVEIMIFTSSQLSLGKVFL